MKTAKIVYEGGLRTRATHLLSGKDLITDAPPDNKGKGEAFSPTDLMSTSLACCMLTIMGIVAERHAIEIKGTSAELVKIMGTEPRRVIEIQIDIFMPEGTYSEKDKALLENAARTCPVAHSLHPDLKQVIRFHWA